MLRIIVGIHPINWIIGGLCFCFMACDSQKIYDVNLDMEDRKWHQDSLAIFAFEISDLDSRYDLSYIVRNTRDYPFHNLFVNYYLENPEGELIGSELQELQLFDPKSGAPLGKGASNLYTHQIVGLNQLSFEKTGTYTFKVQQYMRVEHLEEIVSVGLRIEKVVE